MVAAPLVAVALLVAERGGFQEGVGVVGVLRFLDRGEDELLLLVAAVMKMVVACGGKAHLRDRCHVERLVAGRSVLVVGYTTFVVV